MGKTLSWHLQAGGISLAFPTNMSGFFRSVEFEAKLFIAGWQAFAVLEKAGGLKRRVEAESPGAWLPAATIGGPKHFPLEGGEGHREWLFAQ